MWTITMVQPDPDAMGPETLDDMHIFSSIDGAEAWFCAEFGTGPGSQAGHAAAVWRALVDNDGHFGCKDGRSYQLAHYASIASHVGN